MTGFPKLSAGVIAAAVVGLMMSLSTFFAFVFFLIGIRLGTARALKTGGPFAMSLAYTLMTVLLLAGIACLVISIALLFQKNWARIGALVWAAITTAFSAFGVLLGIVVMLRPRAPSPISARILPVLIFLSGLLIGVWWLILFTRKSVIAEFDTPKSAPPVFNNCVPPAVPPIIVTPIAPLTADDSFSIVRGRTVLLYMVLSLLCTFAVMFVLLIGGSVVYGRSFRFQSPLFLAAIQLSLYGFFTLLGVRLMKRARLKTSEILGSPIGWPQFRKYWSLPLLLIAVSISSYYALYWPLSFAMPRLISWFLFSSRPGELIATDGTGYAVANLVTMVCVVFIAPIVEEFAFRGLLLTRWSIKWGAPRAILLSSAIFGALHKELLGHMFFGFVMCVLYIETRSLFVPILIHAANNALAFSMGLVTSLGPGVPRVTLASFQAQRGTLVLSAIFIPLAVRFIWRHFPKAHWRLPYWDFRETAIEATDAGPASDLLPFV